MAAHPSLMIGAFPELSQADRDLVEAIRARHHPRAAVIAAHFTLVFPTTLMSVEAMREEVGGLVREVEIVPFTLRCAIPFPDLEAGMTDVFLMPDEGFGTLVRLTDRLYSDGLTDVKRVDLPMILHLTVAQFPSPFDAATLARALNSTDIAIHGRVSSVDIVERGAESTRSVARFALQKGKASRS